MGNTSQAIRKALQAQDVPLVGELLTQNHDLLVQLGVSTPKLDLLVDTALSNGALGAKLAGSGGGGVAFALVDSSQDVSSPKEQ